MIILNIFYKNIALKLSIFLFLCLAIISYNHIYKINEVLNLSVNIIGILGWLAFCSSLFASINKDRYFVLSVFLLLITIGSLLGPYLEVPSDPIEHLKRTYSFCDKYSYEIPSRNYGLIHYSMSSIFLCNKILFDSNIVILKINILHGIYFAFLGSSLFLISLNAGLKIKWCFLCLMVMFLFFGTNKFSYFSYYTLAPSCTSIIIYWLWISNFYFKSGIKIFIFGTILFFLSLPILWVNHIQEAAFICLVFFIWVILNFITS